MGKLTTDSAARKRIPLASGVLDYFPRALAAVAEVSLVGNDKHNPGQPLHWAKHKSMDQADCIARHLIERGGMDENGVRHSAQLAWRALALLEEEIARDEGAWEGEVEDCARREFDQDAIPSCPALSRKPGGKLDETGTLLRQYEQGVDESEDVKEERSAGMEPCRHCGVEKVIGHNRVCSLRPKE